MEMSIPALGEIIQDVVIPDFLDFGGAGSGPHNTNMGGDFDLNYSGQNPM